jgi:hypothetical protein
VSKGNELYLRGFNRSNGEKGNGETMIRGRRHLVIPTITALGSQEWLTSATGGGTQAPSGVRVGPQVANQGMRQKRIELRVPSIWVF